jgi:hypothetical protein
MPDIYGIATQVQNPPTSDARPQSPSLVGTSGTIPAPSTDIIMERVLGPDGVMRVVMRQRR